MFGEIIDIMQIPAGKKLHKLKNNIEYMNWYQLLIKYANSRYKFENLPKTVNERVLKEALTYYGSVCFFEKDGNLICLPARATQDYNVYGDPCYAWVYGRNGYNEQIKLYIDGEDKSSFVTKGISGTKVKGGKGVYVRENYRTYPFINYVMQYASKLTDTSRTIDTERFHLKRPYIITAEEAVVNTVKKYMESIGENDEYIISSGIFNANSVNSIPITLPTGCLKETEELQDWYMNQFLTLCGINSNEQINKKERLLVDEVNANNESIDNNIDPMIEYIQEQLDTVNEIYGENITVRKSKKEEIEDDICGTCEPDNTSDNIQQP